jgi:hypothetical protein
VSALAQGQFLSPSRLDPAWGLRRLRKVPNPAAGKEVAFTALGSQLLRVVSLFVVLKASAQAAKRIPALEVQDGDGATVMVITGSEELAEGTTRKITFAPGVATNSPGATGPVSVGIPQLLLEPGFSVSTLTAGVQTEDQYEGAVLWVEEFEAEPSHPRAEMVKLIHEVIKAERAVQYATG